MSRRSKGPRLWLRPARYDSTGVITHEPTWFILDGPKQVSTKYGASEIAGAETALATYIGQKHSLGATGSRDPSQIKIQDVLTRYANNIAVNHSRPWETDIRIGYLESFWSNRTLADVTGDTCREYATIRSTPAAARRELEDLRAAINHHREEGLHDKIVSVVLPPRSPSRERWLTREEAAAVIWAAWRYREVQNFRATDRYTRRHVARWMIVARYMGSRAAVICSASIEHKRPAGRAWVDLDRGVFYGRPEGERETKKRRQTERVPAPLLAHLRRWRKAGQRYVVEWNGEPVTSIRKAHAAAVEAAGLGPDVTPHTWRHTVATWLMQAGADPWKAAGFLAMTVETLMRVYGHHHPDRSAEVHSALRKGGRVSLAAKDIREQNAISVHRSTRKIAKR